MAGGLVLGPVVFQAFEVPERIRFGGRQRLAVHALPGGGRVVDVLGADEGPIEWSGVFAGAGAAGRVRMLDGLRRDGAALLLTWEGWRFSVVIERFETEARHPAWIPYALRACVVAAGEVPLDEGLPGLRAPFAAAASFEEQIANNLIGLQSSDVRAAIDAAGGYARLIVARAMAGAAERGMA